MSSFPPLSRLLGHHGRSRAGVAPDLTARVRVRCLQCPLCDCGLLSSSLRSAATTHPWAAAIRIASLRDGSRRCRPKTRWPGENPARPTRRLSSANVKSINSLTSASVVGASRRHAFLKAILNRAPCLSTAAFCHGVSESVTTGKIQNFHDIMVFEPESSQCGKSLCSCHVPQACSLLGGHVYRDR